MAILAHPDDETLGNGATLARYAAEGVDITLVTATRGQRGWFGDPDENPGLEAVGRTREAELRRAAAALGIRETIFLDYVDGELAEADPDEIVCELVGHIRRVRPQVVVTWGPDGAYGHPDHIAAGQFATAAVARAADPRYGHRCTSRSQHSVSKLYYLALDPARAAAYADAFGSIAMDIDGQLREPVVAPDWLITTRINAGEHWRTVFRAVECHASQLPNLPQLLAMSDEAKAELWGNAAYNRVFSLVNGGRAIEADLFAGLRDSAQLGLVA
jgi:LmbE family N-acetylglucosaminyl deacetylase